MRKESIHFKEMLNERNISTEWVNLALDVPDKIDVNEDGTIHYLKKIEKYNDR